MRTRLLLLFVPFLFLPSHLGALDFCKGDPACAGYAKSARFKEALAILAKYAPEGEKIVQIYLSAPRRVALASGRDIILGGAEDPVVYLEGTPLDKAYISSLAVMVHEICHGLAHTVGYSLSDSPVTGMYAYYIDSEKIMPVKQALHYDSYELAAMIPSELRTMRYPVYIGNRQPTLTAQRDGIYGLMDEWSAYLQEMKVRRLLGGWFEDERGKTALVYGDWLGTVQGNLVAHYEFRYYSLFYLKNARENHPDVYKATLANRDLLGAMQSVNKSFEKEIELFEKKRAEIGRLFPCTVPPEYQNGEYFFLGNRGIGTFASQITPLKKEVEKPEYERIKKDFGL